MPLGYCRNWFVCYLSTNCLDSEKVRSNTGQFYGVEIGAALTTIIEKK